MRKQHHRSLRFELGFKPRDHIQLPLGSTLVHVESEMVIEPKFGGYVVRDGMFLQAMNVGRDAHGVNF